MLWGTPQQSFEARGRALLWLKMGLGCAPSMSQALAGFQPCVGWQSTLCGHELSYSSQAQPAVAERK